jgi:hypothetical protein
MSKIIPPEADRDAAVKLCGALAACGFRSFMTKDFMLMVAGHFASHALAARIEGARAVIEGITDAIESGYPKLPKAETCEHGQLGCQDCIGCYDEFLFARLASLIPTGAA